jgi:hypothetical protein
VQQNLDRKVSLGRILQVRSLFGHDRAFDGADLKTDATVNAGGKINPVPVRTFRVFPRTFVDAGNWASVYTIGNAFASIGHDRMRHKGLVLGFSFGFKSIVK